MTLHKLIQMRQGAVSMKVFREARSGGLLFSLDKDLGSRKLMGPLFAEEELYLLLDIMLDYDEWESGAFHDQPNRRIRNNTPVSSGSQESVQEEIQAAITEAVKEATPWRKVRADEGMASSSQATIQVLPSMPEYRYVYTCPNCRGHVASQSVLSGGNIMSLCGWCDHVNHVEGW